MKEFKLVDLFDSLLSKNRDHHITNGEAIYALILNGLSFHPRRLYRISDFLDQLPLPMFFRPELKSTFFNDDALGGTLDTIHAFGATEFYNLVISDFYENNIDNDYNIDFSSVNCDTTNFTVTGEYKIDKRSSSKRIIIPTYGHNKDKRTDRKMWILGLISNTDGIPLFVRAYSGNTSDHKSLKEMMDKVASDFKENLLNEDDQYCIFDSAGYTEKNIKNLGCKFVSRVPETITEVKDLVSSNVCLIHGNNDQGYSFYEHESKYAGVPQKWFLIRSEQTAKSEDEKFKKKCLENFKKANIALCHLNKKFDTKEEAINATEKWLKNYPYLKFSNIEIIEKLEKHFINKNCHTLGKELKKSYKIKVTLVINKEAIEQEMMTHGRFVLGSNDINLTGEEMLKIYKTQRSVENGFRLLKDKEFLIGQTFLKKPERIEALGVIMILCLLIYSLLELKVRKAFADNNVSIPKPNKTNNFNPTLKEVFKQFQLVACIESVDKSGNVTYVIKGLTPDSPVVVILRVLGKKFLQFFSIDDIDSIFKEKKLS
jgi:transposase